MKTLLLILYLSKGNVILEKSYHDNQKKCQVSGVAQAYDIIKRKGYEEGLYIGCIDLSVKQIADHSKTKPTK